MKGIVGHPAGWALSESAAFRREEDLAGRVVQREERDKRLDVHEAKMEAQSGRDEQRARGYQALQGLRDALRSEPLPVRFHTAEERRVRRLANRRRARVRAAVRSRRGHGRPRSR